jgi:AcrR family transcriptional regulator
MKSPVTHASKLPARRPDRRIARTREALMGAGRSLFAQRSVREVSIDEIVQAADVAKGSFYNHFLDKEALAAEVVRSVRLRLAKKVDAANESVTDPVDALVRGLYVVFQFGLDDPDSGNILMRLTQGSTALDAPLNRRIMVRLMAGIEQGAFSHVGIEDGVLLVMGVAVAGQRRTLDDRTPGISRELAVALGAGMLRALGVPAKRATAKATKAAQEILFPAAK